ncbi:S-protein homolog 2-like [Macadamia integrifolia]|uniref:S-protein homolog 2-like n=1 Tax=Macadamia integrifolia TaxID=60698 RepID=UPI001C4FC679|nr:S-protein homolog 2-like [Macadamia integrifolia]
MNALKLFIVLAFTLALLDPYFVQGTYYVYVMNDLGPNEILFIDCRSKDDRHYLPQRLPYGQEFIMDIEINFFVTTLYWCNLDWKDKRGSFEIFNAKKELFKCGGGTEGDCFRKVRKDGIYYNEGNRDGDYWKKYSW